MVGILASNVYSDSRTWDQNAVTVSALDALDLFVQSEIWSDILRSQSVHPEISFSLKYNPVDEPDSDSVPSVLGGAIDLVYRRDEGWVLVDYKTDFLSKKDLIDRYGAQLEAYEFAWQSLTGEKIIEKGFFAVGSGEYIPIKTAYSKTERM